MKLRELTINHISVDDCALIGRLIHRPRLALTAQVAIDYPLGRVSSPVARKRRVQKLGELYDLAQRHDYEIKAPQYPHELCAAWLVWSKSNDPDLYDEALTGQGWSNLLTLGRDKTDVNGAEQTVELITYGARRWVKLLRNYAGSDLHRYHRSLSARVHPETAKWARFDLLDVRDGSLGLVWVVT